MAGAHVAYRVRVQEPLRQSGGRVNGVVVESRGVARGITASIVVAADGVNSTVARRVDATPYLVGAHASAVIYTRVNGLAVDGYHWHYVPGASVGVIPTNGGETLLFAGSTRRRFMQDLQGNIAAWFEQILTEAAPQVAWQLRNRQARSYHGFAGRAGAVRPAWGPGWALVGDAGYFKDPITAHGITDALRDAELLARAVVAGTSNALARYQTVRDKLSLRLFATTDEIASFAWDIPRLQALHKQLSEEMAQEARYVAAEFDASPIDSPPVAMAAGQL
jgi:menaquinone-9 beta-reductase